MKPFHKVALVAGGYIAAILLACAVVALHVAVTSGPVAQASSGMHAFGDALLFVAVFGMAALLPTAAALFFLRPYEGFWKLLAGLGVVLAITGVAAAIVFAVGRHATAGTLADWSAFSALRILVAPLFALGFLVCALFAPHRGARIAFLAATAMEALTSAYGAAVWLVPIALQLINGR